ncbi:MAG: DUF4956 domain-containing protein [Lachnospiraceae bacterium]|nr:DUF4956 domain-containing protein [Lachnospiraceae bacterium]
MGIKDIIKKSFLQGYASNNITLNTVLICLACTLVLAIYIYLIYKLVNKNSFYNKNFNLSLIVIALITASIILTIQSNVVVSLGMVGALSIVRFRTAIKDPMDLGFLFWSISAGIIAGAGFAMIAVAASLVISVVILLFSAKATVKGSLLLVVNANSYSDEKEIVELVSSETVYMKVRARNASKSSLNMAIEVKAKDQGELIKKVIELPCVLNASLVEHDGEITA